MRILTFKDDKLKFHAAHYLPHHSSCGVLHGHTYFLRDVEIECSNFVDFGDIKKVIDGWSHKLIIPYSHEKMWLEKIEPILNGAGVKIPFRSIQGTSRVLIKAMIARASFDDSPTVENISTVIGKELEAIKGVEAVQFILLEGPDQGAAYKTKLHT